MRSSHAIAELSAHHALTTLPEVWLDLAHGRVSADEAATAMAGREPPELIERSKVLFLPASAEAEDRRLAALLETHFPARGREAAVEDGRVVQLPTPARRRVPRWIGAAAVAVAAQVLLIVPPPRPEPFDGGYALQMSPGHAEERGEPIPAEGTHLYREGQRIALVMQPRDAMQALGVVAFVVTEDGATPLRVEPAFNEHGVVSIAGTPEALGLPLGRSRLVVVIGPPDDLPRAFSEGVYEHADAPYDVADVVVEIVAAPDAPPP